MVDLPVFSTANEVNGEEVRCPFFAGAADAAERSSGDFAVHFTFEVTPKATGRRTTLEEVGVYTVKDNKITREQFYHEGSR